SQRLMRADGLAAGPHRLRLRLPGAATLVSEVVEVGPGEARQLPPAVPGRGLAIGGRVLDAETLQPVAGARVSCEPGSPHRFRKPHELETRPTATSGADGLFLLEGLDAGRCRALVRAPGYAAWRLDGVEPDEIGTDLGDVELDHGMAVVGRVVDRAGRPQTGIAVEVFEAAAYAYFAETTVRSDHDGWFRAEGLPAGRWTLTASRGGERARATVEGAAGDTASAELRLGGVDLEGEVFIGDRPAAGGSLVLAGEGARGDGMVVMVQTGADDRRLFGIEQPPLSLAVAGDGRFAAAGVSPGVYTASYTPPGAGGSPVSRELVVPQVETHRCVIRFADAGVDGAVVDGDGRPVAGAMVLVRAADGSVRASGFSNGDGAFAFVGLDPGIARLGAVHGEYGDAPEVEVELRTGDRAGPVTLELGPPDGAELTLTVRSDVGSLGGAPVYLVGADTATGFTDSAGVVAFTGVAPGQYRACAAAYGGAVGCGPELALDDGEVARSELTLGRGGLVQVLLGPQERVPPLRVMTADGIDLSGLLMMVSPPAAGPDGLLLGALRADRYRVTVSTASGPRDGDVTVREGETVTLDLR
ncbi:MAG TPA: carboxypeptidase-like regulatory domain-containing protein, partial [Candidatus Sulfomarinibacteraceae bacterium]|nr:carboxypeptidase-like regulatory domain-containing protein [Candidatus Sulfomarinibacteraceae bacterium]